MPQLGVIDEPVRGGCSSTTSGPDPPTIEGTEAYVWTPDGVKAMTLSYAHLEQRFGVVATARNWNIVEKIAAKL